MSYIYRAMGWILNELYQLLSKIGLGNYAYAILLFTILVNLVFLPLSIHQQRTMAKQVGLRPKLEALKAKCGDDQRKYQTEMQALYQREKVSMTGGCWMLFIRLPFLWGVWMAIRSPLSYILNVSDSVIASAKELLIQQVPAFAGKAVSQIAELDVVHNISTLAAHDAGLKDVMAKVQSLNFNFFGVDLTETPHFTLNFAKAQWIWVIPILSFLTAMLSSLVSMQMQKKTNPDMGGQMGCMMLSMPLISLWIAFTVPGAVGFYWACSNVVTMVVQMFMNRFYGPYTMVAREAAARMAKRKEKERQLMKNSEVSDT